jgi:hypothetical protein
MLYYYLRPGSFRKSESENNSIEHPSEGLGNSKINNAKVATTVTEALQLIEAGFDYVCDMGEIKIFRKRK